MENKKGVSEIVGYVLLIVFTLILAGIVYTWLRTYVPQEDINCPDGTSLTIKSYTCNQSANNKLSLNLENNGKFFVGGYFIDAYYYNSKGNLSLVDFTKNNTDALSQLNPIGIKFGQYISGGNSSHNSLEIGKNETDTYSLIGIPHLKSVMITPFIWTTQDRKLILSSCKDIVINQDIQCN